MLKLCLRLTFALALAGTAATAQDEPPAQTGTAPPAAASSAEGTADPSGVFRVGMVPRGDVRAFLEAMRPLRDGLAAAVGRPVEILPMASLSALVDAQVLQRIDAGFYSAAAYASAEALCRCLEPLVAPAASDGTTAFHAVILARSTSGIAAVADLEGKRVAAGPPDSVGARQVQLAGLKEEGVEAQSFFAEIVDAGSAVAAVRMMLDGRADAAFAWSSLAGEPERGYSRGTLAWLAARGEIAMDDIVIVWQSRPIAHGPFAVRNALPQHERTALEAYLLGLGDSDPELYDRLDILYGGGFRPVEPADYRAVAAIVGGPAER
ncbi:MAG TPA: phosphate/phosphite/phosphonate ABC transporter substrate-binding protein [Afifellaceae bacterium]|nr:phosphate/phosphite/phosphonate ABC transporter substrate-binding protein [Afifellaceae bacterium]